MSRIRLLRLLQGDSLDTLAAKLSLAPSVLSVVERYGAHRNVGRSTKRRLSRHFGIPFSDLVKIIDPDTIAIAVRAA